MASTLEPIVFPMHGSWRAAIALVLVMAGVAAALCAAELIGLVARGTLIGDASDAERLAGLAVGMLVQPFGISALRHGRLAIDGSTLRCLRLGFVCRTQALPLAEVRRWGSAIATNRGRRERHLLLGLRDGTEHAIKLAMYRGASSVLDHLTTRLGPPTSASPTIGGIRFDDPA